MEKNTIKKFLLIIFIIFSCFFEIFSMGLTSNFRLLTWSEDGRYAFIENSVDGPEGGGEIIFYIIGGDNFVTEKYLLSNNLSPGDGSRPERVNEIQYWIELKKLNESLKAKKFLNIKVKAQFSDKRYNSIIIDNKKIKIKEGVFKKSFNTYIYQDIALTVNKKDLELEFKNKKVKTIDNALFNENSNLNLFISPTGKMIIVFLQSNNYGGYLLGYFYTSSGEWNNSEYHSFNN